MAYMIEVRGVWAGGTGDWRPACSGTLNQSGFSDEYASSFDSRAEAEEQAMELRESADGNVEFRIVEVPAIQVARLHEAGAGFPLKGEFVTADGQLYRVHSVRNSIEVDRARTGLGDYVLAELVSVAWDETQAEPTPAKVRFGF